MVTLNKIISSLEAIANAHYQINSFGFGEIADFATSGKINYPAMYVEAGNMELVNSSSNITVRVWLIDRLLKGKRNLNEVFSDTQQIGIDVVSQMNSHIYEWTFPKESPITFNPIYESELDDEVAGFYFDLVLKAQFDYNRCRIPFDSTITTSGVSSTVNVTILDQDGNVVTTVECGSSYTVTIMSGIVDSLPSSYSNSVIDNLS